VKRTLYETDLRTACVLCIGGEKRGLSGAVRSICDAFLTIPSASDASSLSLSHASAIVMAEAMRQRRFADRSPSAEQSAGDGGWLDDALAGE
jgi:TrmH family RNA methyltransferase